MKNLLIDPRDIRYTLFEVLDVDSILNYDRYKDFDHDIFEDTIDLIESIAVNECYPAFDGADKKGCTWDPDTKEVTCPDEVKNPLKAYYDAGFIGIGDDQEIGGMGLPASVSAVHIEYLSAAHQSLMMYTGLAHGSMSLIHKFGTDEQKETYIPKMMEGKWGGTMCLTEPQAGSDVGRMTAKAIKQPDGSYQIIGQKIFISAGDNDLYENIVHPVLARVEGDPEGTKGISIFIVPKYFVKDDGTFGDSNNVICTGVEHKMGIKGCVTCTLSFGEDGPTTGYLLGKECMGMKIMFNMMNDFRMATAVQGQAVSSAALNHAAAYAKTREQGTAIEDMMKPVAPMVPILNHPDVSRMLLWMKSYVDAQRLLIYFMYHNMDLARVADGDVAKESQAIVDFLVPICKASCSDQNVLITAEAMQVFGGYGFCSDYPIEQMMRNSKILAIFEGANGIQGMDLIMRKLLMNPEQYNYSIFTKMVKDTIESAKGIINEIYITPVAQGLEKLELTVDSLKEMVSKFNFAEILSAATPFRKAIYMLSLAWMHLWNLTVATPKMNSIIEGKEESISDIIKDNNDGAFYHGRILASRFFIRDEFPKYNGMIEGLLNRDKSVLEVTEDIFYYTADL